MSEVRLQKFLSAAGVCSRRAAEDMMRQGRVLVDGVPALDVGRKIDPDKARVEVDGRTVAGIQDLRYFMFHKPAGFLTSFHDPQGRPTVRPFLEGLTVRVFPVGRLDMDVSGLLILTNDGELGKRLMHPSSLIPKVYRVLVQGVPDEGDLERMRRGRLIIDHRPAAPAKAQILASGPDRGWLELTLTEGRHRQVKRMCSAIGHKVVRLKRVAYCGIALPGDLPWGQIRQLTRAQVDRLRNAVGLGPAGAQTP
jgi:23S rRNA pseudouridine2605 synthase